MILEFLYYPFIFHIFLDSFPYALIVLAVSISFFTLYFHSYTLLNLKTLGILLQTVPLLFISYSFILCILFSLVTINEISLGISKYIVYRVFIKINTIARLPFLCNDSEIPSVHSLGMYIFTHILYVIQVGCLILFLRLLSRLQW